MPDPREDAVRRLLADARHDQPPPPEVVARLDRVVADLAEQRAAATAADQLAARRRRRSRLLGGWVAAAVAVVALVAGGRWLGGQEGLAGSSSSDSAGGAAAPEAAPDHLPYLRPGHLRDDVLRRIPDRTRRGATGSDATACVVPRSGQTVLSVSYGGRLAALVLDRPADGTQRAALYRCQGVHPGDAVRTLTLPAP